MYDLVLSAETVYTQEVTHKVVNFLKSHLAIPNRPSTTSSLSSETLIEDERTIEKEQVQNQGGIALIGGKRYYFGTGGGTGYLMSLLKEDPDLTGDIVATFENCKSNIREIILVKRR